MDMRPWTGKVREIVRTHEIGTGRYARWLRQDSQGKREMGMNPYGCADAANILYTLGDFPREADARAGWIDALQAMQSTEDGLYHERTHHPIHTTAHCVAALELFDARPAQPLHGLLPYLDTQKMAGLLQGLDWEGNPWPQSHRGAGLYAALVITGDIDSAWEDAYFTWLGEHASKAYGMGLEGRVDLRAAPLAHQLFGWFHYLFNHAYARRPFPHAHALIDTCLALYHDGGLTENFGRSIGFREIDWIYALNRACVQTGYRFAEGKRALQDFAQGFCAYLLEMDTLGDDDCNDLHSLFGTVCAVAELQQALPGEIKTAVPLKLVLDRRPFI